MSTFQYNMDEYRSQQSAEQYQDNILENIWNMHTVKPNKNGKILIVYVHLYETDFQVAYWDNDTQSLDNDDIDWKDVIRWMYITDLLPTKLK